jgi:hypothetical protein
VVGSQVGLGEGASGFLDDLGNRRGDLALIEGSRTSFGNRM